MAYCIPALDKRAKFNAFGSECGLMWVKGVAIELGADVVIDKA